MPKYWVKQIFSLGSFPKVGQNQKTERETLNDGNNNGQLRIANVTLGGAGKPPGPKIRERWNEKKLILNQGPESER